MRSALSLFAILFLTCPLPYACQTTITKQSAEIKIFSSGSDKKADSLRKSYRPVFGYRFVVTGDFDGDGVKEKLIEHYYSGIDYKETNKYYDSLPDHGDEIDSAIKRRTLSFVQSENKSIDTLKVCMDGSSFGLLYLKNEGDLDGDGGDEISYVGDWADWSTLNTWHIMTYKNNHWKEMYSFPIWEFQIPSLPVPTNDCQLTNRENNAVYEKGDTTDKQLQVDLREFKGLVKKVGTNKIRIIFRNDEIRLDTAVVNLNNPKTWH